jgi:hypothetical protein
MHGDDKPALPAIAGVAEAAAMLGLSKSALCARRKPGCALPMPAPVRELLCGPIWLRTQIEQYAAAMREASGPSYESRFEDILHALAQDDAG